MTGLTIITGLGVSPGLGLGRAHLLGPVWESVARLAASAAADTLAAEKIILAAAIGLAATRLDALAAEVARGLGADKAAIFEAEKLLLEDEEFTGEIEARLAQGESAAIAALGVCRDHAALLSSLADPYLRQRAPDMENLGLRLAAAALGLDPDAGALPDGPLVVFADELSPAEVAGLAADTVVAIVCERGGATSHAAILAAARGIPAVFAAQGALNALGAAAHGGLALVDALAGEVRLNPSEAEIAAFTARIEAARATAVESAPQSSRPAPPSAKPAILPSGERIALHANIGSSAEAGLAAKAQACGVGLFRLEFLYLGLPAPPPEEAIFAAIAQAAADLPGRPVTVRLLDAGGDKELPWLGLPACANPALSPRGARLLASHPHVFMPQIRATLRAAASAPVRLLLPMTAGPDDMLRLRAMCDAAARELNAAGIAHAESLPLGAMIETPAAAYLGAQIAAVSDFLSIGANDLTQYTLAVDREGGDGFDPLHPAVLASIKSIAEAAKNAAVPVSVCGEVAGTPDGARILAGLGIRELSMNPARIAAVRDALTEGQTG